MELPTSARRAPVRAATGTWILHSGVEKWVGGEDEAKDHHSMTAVAFPFVKKVSPRRFLRLVAGTEITVGAVMLAPFISPGLAGAALVAFSAGLLSLYFRSPDLHKPGSVWPTFEGIAVSKDVWMLGIGVSLVTDAIIEARRHRV